MAKIEVYTPGSFCWAELATTDPAAAKQFYGEMFGWTAVDMPMPEGVYTLFQADGNDAAAVYTTRPGVPVHWGVYFRAGFCLTRPPHHLAPERREGHRRTV